MLTAAEAHAADVVAAVPHEVFATADATPLLYFGFLGASLTFALGTVSTLPRCSRSVPSRASVCSSPLFLTYLCRFGLCSSEARSRAPFGISVKWFVGEGWCVWCVSVIFFILFSRPQLTERLRRGIEQSQTSPSLLLPRRLIIIPSCRVLSSLATNHQFVVLTKVKLI